MAPATSRRHHHCLASARTLPSGMGNPTVVMDMLSYEIIVAPLARALWSLEATTDNPSDTFVFWLAITHTLNSIFEKKEKDTGISPKLAVHVRTIFNTRYIEFFSHNDDIQMPNFCAHVPTVQSALLNPRLIPTHFFRVKEFLKNRLKALLRQHASHTSDCRCHPILKTQSDRDTANALRLQLETFWLGEPPFHAPAIRNDIMEWWMNLERGNSPRSNRIAVNINSMPDERTNSKINWFNSPLRGNQKPEGLLDMIMIGQWYRYHATSADGPRCPPRRPTVAFCRLDQAVIDKVKMSRREEDSDVSDSDTESTEIDGEDDSKELEEISNALRAKLAKKQRRKEQPEEDVQIEGVVVGGRRRDGG
ncbi:hypothetical protein B0H14DRAFT_2586849 [Mycena olivaceomarginata]|nr:hypothetical protein B0H14DRAFT_2586849 [Mycena olivaceomarginata]